MANKAHLLTPPGVPQYLETTLSLPYTLTTGKAAGSFMTALASKRIVGSHCTACDRTVAPAQDYCITCAAECELVEVATSGVVTAKTTTPEQTLVFVLLDGTACPMMHKLLGDADAVSIGDRVQVQWAERAEDAQPSILDIAGFVKGGSEGAAAGGAVEIEDAIAEWPYELDLDYKHAYGPFYGRMFDELASGRRILGSPCPSCHKVMVPPRERCDICFARTTRLVEVKDTGVVQAFSVVHLEFVGQTRTPPYIYAEIMLDGCATRLIHNVGGFDMAEAKERCQVGMRVKAVWKDTEPQGSLDDIDYFEPIE